VVREEGAFGNVSLRARCNVQVDTPIRFTGMMIHVREAPAELQKKPAPTEGELAILGSKARD
jgi:hypothetical protein